MRQLFEGRRYVLEMKMGAFNQRQYRYLLSIVFDLIKQFEQIRSVKVMKRPYGSYKQYFHCDENNFFSNIFYL